MWIVVLAVHENDLFGAAGDVQLPAVHQPEVAGAQPAVGGERGGIGFPIFVVAARDVGPRHVHVADAILGQLAVLIVRDAHAAVGDGPALADESNGVRVGCRHWFHRIAGVHAVAVEREGAQRRAHRGEAHRERGFRQAVHRVHGVARELRGREPGEELIAQLHRDRLGAVENEPHGRQIQCLHRALPQHLQIVFVAEVRRAQDRGAHP